MKVENANAPAVKREAEEDLGAMKEPRRTPAGEMLLARNLGHAGRILNDEDVIQLLRAVIEREGDQAAFARRHGMDRTYVNQVLNKKKPISGTVIKALGLRKVYAP